LYTFLISPLHATCCPTHFITIHLITLIFYKTCLQQNTIRAPNGYYSFSWDSTHSTHGILNGVTHSIQIHTGIVLQSNSNFKAYC
jgi:hypothetical protein